MYHMTQNRLNSDNLIIQRLIVDCDAIIDQLSKSDRADDERSMWMWVDRRAALVQAIESI